MSLEISNKRRNRDNNFGFLRLLFATLVIVSHSAEMVDGNRSREILTVVFGTMSFGEIAVDGFFLISGYLITKSFVETRDLFDYMAKRVFRIYPAYIVCSLACVFLIAPLVGGGFSSFSPRNIARELGEIFLLWSPQVPGAFQNLPYPSLDGSMWTIAYEFRCYIAVAVLGTFGVFVDSRLRIGLIGLVLTAIILLLAETFTDSHVIGARLIGSPGQNVRLFAAFGVGSLYYLFRDLVTFTGMIALAALVLATALMFSPRLAEPAFIILGGYCIFWFVFRFPVLRAGRFEQRTDISYGLYLYAFPIQNLVIWQYRNVNPWILCVVTLIGAGLIAFASWIWIEKPALTLAKKITRSRRAAVGEYRSS